MNLFSQQDFRGGLNAEFNRLLQEPSTYPLLVNGRSRAGTISPVRGHLRDTGVPSGNYQDLVVAGNYLIVFISGIPYYRDLSNDSATWNILTDWADNPMDATAEIHSQLLPVSANTFKRVAASTADNPADGISNIFLPQIAQTPQALEVSNGIDQPRLIFQNGSWRLAKTFAEWSVEVPEYIPLHTISTLLGNKMIALGQDGRKMLQSVTGRPIDFMVNITADGSAGGDADTLCIVADYNTITGLKPSADGGYIATTLFATYQVGQDPLGRTQFGEAVLGPPRLIFPVGCVNHYSFADIIGDMAFISQTGIQSFNTVSQTQTENRSNPFSATIANYLAEIQTETCAINFGDYALFSIDTIFGRAVAVYDTIRRAFISFDLGFGVVKRFAVFRQAGRFRLFFINASNELYEAYASPNYAICRILLGDFSVQDVAGQHNISRVFSYFTDIRESTEVGISLYSDNVLVDRTVKQLTPSALVPPAPGTIPFLDKKETAPIVFDAKTKRTGYKSSLLIEWRGNAQLVGITAEGSTQSTRSPELSNVITQEVDEESYAFVGDLGLGNSAVTSDGSEFIQVAPGYTYYVTGTAHLGNYKVTNAAFKPETERIRVVGSLYLIDYVDEIFNVIQQADVNGICLGGNQLYPVANNAAYSRLRNFLSSKLAAPFFGCAGNYEMDVNGGKAWFARFQRYYVQSTTWADFFIVNGGWLTDDQDVDSTGATLNPSSEIDGIAETSEQMSWIRKAMAASSARFKIVVVHYPPYTDGDAFYPGFADLRLPWKAWGADLVLSAKTLAYERFYIDGLQYVVAGTGGRSTEGFKYAQRSVYRKQAYGYVRLAITPFDLRVQFIDIGNVLRDETAILAK